jgi:PPOX class probable F420-dependent enzyme
MDLPPAAPIPAAIRRFLEAPNYAALATTGADDEPHQAVIWYRLEPDDRILVNSRVGRRWPTELRADPRCSLAIFEVGDAYRWVGLQGVVESVIDDLETGRDDIVALAHRYDDASPTTISNFRSQTRVSFRIRVVSIHDHL